MNTTEGIRTRYAAIPALVLFLLACVYIVNAATQLTPIIPAVTVGTNANYDTLLKSGWQDIQPDSLYKWVATLRGTANYCIKIMSQFNGVAGDTVTVDSVIGVVGYESYVATVNGDSLMDLAWPQWTSYSAAARTVLKSMPASFKYQIVILVLSGTGHPVFSLSRLTY